MSVKSPILMPSPLICCAKAAGAAQRRAVAILKFRMSFLQGCKSSWLRKTSDAQVIDQFLVAGPYLLARPGFLHLAVDDEDMPVGEREREMQVGLDQQHGLAAGLQLAQDAADLLHHHRREPFRRLVEEQQRRPGPQDP